MRPLKFLFLLVGVLANASTTLLHAQSCASIPTVCVGALPNPDPWILNNASITIEPYMARSITFDDLANDYENPNTRPRVVEDIDVAVRLRAMFLVRAGGIWANVGKYSWPGYPASLPGFVNLVNAKYDCAGLRRPLIQASVFTESISDEFYDHNSARNPARNVYIHTRVIQEFASEIQAAGATAVARYFEGNGTTPKSTVVYDYGSIVWIQPNGEPMPDITKLEARMWMFQQAMIYLDAGFTSIHLGQTGLFAKLWIYDSGRNQRMQLLADFVQHIRSYAASPPTANSNRRAINYLPIASEPLTGSNNSYVKFTTGSINGKDQLIFDMVVAAMRPREINPSGPGYISGAPSMDTRDRNETICPADNGYLGMFNGTNCQGKPRLAVIDPCHGFYMLPDGGGVAPGNRVYDTATPYSIYFDFGNGVSDTVNHQRGEFYMGREGTWNYDDARWFSTALDAACRADWMRTELPLVRSFVNSKSFLQLPGRLYAADLYGIPEYRLSQESATLDEICQAWAIADPQPAIQFDPCSGTTWGTCKIDGTTFVPRRYPMVNLSVPTPDVTSIYTWHILNTTTGNWEPMTYGTTRTFLPNRTGSYTIYLKQDNLGFANGETSRTYSRQIYISPQCCTDGYYRSSQQPFTLVSNSDAQQVFAQEQAQLLRGDTKSEHLKNVKVEIFPQPTNGNVNIAIDSKVPLSVSGIVTDLTGRIVQTIPASNYNELGIHVLNVDIANIPAGIYSVILRLNDELQSHKLLIK